MYRNLFIVFLLSGLWHGANFTFIIWGALHAVYVLTESLFPVFKNESVVLKLLKQLKVFVLVTIAWVFFRASNLNEAIEMMKLMFSTDFSLNMTQLAAGKGPFNLALSFLAILFLLLAYFLPRDMQFKKTGTNIAFLTVSIILLFILSKDAQGEFIYFQF